MPTLTLMPQPPTIVLASPDAIDDNPWQPRRVHTDPPEATAQALNDLMESIARNGLLHPPIARIVRPGRYEMGVGHRRRDAIAALISTQDPRWTQPGIPLDIRDYTDVQAATWALTENTERLQLTPIEEIRAWKALLDMQGMTQAQLATLIGKPRPTLANALRLLTLPQDVLDLVDAGSMPTGAAAEFLALDDSPAAAAVRQETLASCAHTGDYRRDTVARTMASLARDKGWRQLDNLSQWERKPEFDVELFAREHPDTIYTIRGARYTSDKAAYGKANKVAILEEKAKEEKAQPRGPAPLGPVQATDPVIRRLAREQGVAFDPQNPDRSILKAAGTRGKKPPELPRWGDDHVDRKDYSPYIDATDCRTCTNGATYIRSQYSTANERLACVNMDCYNAHLKTGATAWQARFEEAAQVRDGEALRMAVDLEAVFAAIPHDTRRLLAHAVFATGLYAEHIRDTKWHTRDPHNFAGDRKADKYLSQREPATLAELRVLLNLEQQRLDLHGPTFRENRHGILINPDEHPAASSAKALALAAAYFASRDKPWPAQAKKRG